MNNTVSTIPIVYTCPQNRRTVIFLWSWAVVLPPIWILSPPLPRSRERAHICQRILSLFPCTECRREPFNTAQLKRESRQKRKCLFIIIFSIFYLHSSHSFLFILNWIMHRIEYWILSCMCCMKVQSEWMVSERRRQWYMIFLQLVSPKIQLIHMCVEYIQAQWGGVTIYFRDIFMPVC